MKAKPTKQIKRATNEFDADAELNRIAAKFGPTDALSTEP